MSKTVIKFILTFFLVTVIGCEKKSDNLDYVVKVNNSYLTRSELASLVDTSSISREKLSEVVKAWIHRELLFQEATKEGILKEQAFKDIIKKSERELAGAMLLEKMINLNDEDTDQDELKNYYRSNINEFRIPTDAFVINRVDFIDEDKAISFRSLAVQGDWKKASANFANDPGLIFQASDSFLLGFEISPLPLYKLVSELYPQEISIVISPKPGYYSIVQLIEKLDSGSIPAFDYVKNEVRKRLFNEKRQIIVDQYIKELYTDSDIEIKFQETNEN